MADRKLDLSIAKEFFGFDIIDQDEAERIDNETMLERSQKYGTPYWPLKGYYVRDFYILNKSRTNFQNVPQYSLLTQDTWEIIEKLENNGCLVKIQNTLNKKWKCLIRSEQLTFESEGKTVEMAICLSVIKLSHNKQLNGDKDHAV